jgi:hypothetical protein
MPAKPTATGRRAKSHREQVAVQPFSESGTCSPGWVIVGCIPTRRQLGRRVAYLGGGVWSSACGSRVRVRNHRTNAGPMPRCLSQPLYCPVALDSTKNIRFTDSYPSHTSAWNRDTFLFYVQRNRIRLFQGRGDCDCPVVSIGCRRSLASRMGSGSDIHEHFASRHVFTNISRVAISVLGTLDVRRFHRLAVGWACDPTELLAIAC